MQNQLILDVHNVVMFSVYKVAILHAKKVASTNKPYLPQKLKVLV